MSLIISRILMLFVAVSLGCIAADSNSTAFETLKLKQTLVDNQHSVDGLAGARVAEFTPDGQQLLVVSADDNSLAIFNVDANFKLFFSQMFVNSSDVDALKIDGLEGATSLVVSPYGRYAYVVSFYDSGIAIFEKNEKGTYRFIRAIRDGLSYDEIFSNKESFIDKESVRKKDTLGLLGAYDIAITSDNRQLYVASVASSAVSIFDIKNANDENANDENANEENNNEENNKGRQNQISHVAFKRAIRDSDDSKLGLGGAVNLVITPDDSQVIVAGFNENAITIFNRDINGELEHSQTLTNGEQQIINMKAPQGLAISPGGRYLYAACSASNALVVFERDEQGKYSFFQTISNEQNIISGLGGASYVTASPDGNRVYVAAESDKAIVTLTRKQDGTLQIISVVRSTGTYKEEDLNGPASVYAASDGKHLIVTTGKGNTLIVYKVD